MQRGDFRCARIGSAQVGPGAQRAAAHVVVGRAGAQCYFMRKEREREAHCQCSGALSVQVAIFGADLL